MTASHSIIENYVASSAIKNERMMSMQPPEHFGDEPAASSPPPFYDGSWERGGRSLNAAAILGLLGIGVIYFNAQTILASIGIGVAYLSSSGNELPKNFLERLATTSKLYAEPIRVALVVSQYLFMLLPAWWLVKRWHTRRVREYVRLASCPLHEIIFAILATVAFIPTGTYIANALTRQLKIPDFLIEINSEIFTAHSLGEFIWLLFVIAITPALCEEIFFRGFVQRTFERTLQGKSVLLIGVIFGLFHMQPLGLITISMLGILFGYFYYRSKSLLPSMAAHFTNNFIAIFFLYREPKIDDVSLASTEQIPLSWLLATLPVAVGVLFLYHKVTRRKVVGETGLAQQGPTKF